MDGAYRTYFGTQDGHLYGIEPGGPCCSTSISAPRWTPTLRWAPTAAW
ncbi:MAG: hypothetical protein M3Y48_06740 [Actinomycetota bacterium]|nr:hypothetical protein [Actinomycetota bacterium]